MPLTPDIRVPGLLARGLAAGFFAGLVAALFAILVGEPAIDRAIAFETAIEGTTAEPELVSRSVQSREGLLTAGALYGAAVGGFFGLVFASAQGRIGPRDPRARVALLAAAGFLAIALVPGLKYPANPPAVGSAETIAIRTALYLAMILVSVAALAGAAAARAPFCRRFGPRIGLLASAALFLGLVGIAALVLPPVDEAGAEFPSDLLFVFRSASLSIQAVLWAALGFGFALLLPRSAPRGLGA